MKAAGLLFLFLVFSASNTLAQDSRRIELADAVVTIRILELRQVEAEQEIARLKSLVERLTSELADEAPRKPLDRRVDGKTMSEADRLSLLTKIYRCWNVGALSVEALKVSLTIGFTMTPDAKPEIGSINLISAEGGSGGAVDRAYEAARRAIIRCGSSGFGLPADKYDQWRGVEVKFNATTKEIR